MHFTWMALCQATEEKLKSYSLDFFCISNRNNNSYFLKMKKKNKCKLNLDLKTEWIKND